MKRVAIIGTTGSGKTILAARVADLLQCPHIELDALFWLADWKPVPSEDFRRRVREAISGKFGLQTGTISARLAI